MRSATTSRRSGSDLREEASRGIGDDESRSRGSESARGEHGRLRTHDASATVRAARRSGARIRNARRRLRARRGADPRRRHQPLRRAAAVADRSPRSRASSSRSTCCTVSGRRRRKCCGRACCSSSSASASACCCSGSGCCAARARRGSARSPRRRSCSMYPLFLVIFGRSATTIVMIGFVAGLPPVILKTIEGLAGTRTVLLDVGRSFRPRRLRSNSARSCCRPRCRASSSACARTDLRADQHRRRRVPDQLRRPRPADQRARRTLRSAGHVRGDRLRHSRQRPLLRRLRARRAMAAARLGNERTGRASTELRRLRVAGAQSPAVRMGAARRDHRRVLGDLGSRRRVGMALPRCRAHAAGRSPAPSRGCWPTAASMRTSAVTGARDRRGARNRRHRRARRRHGARRQPLPARAYEGFIYYLGPTPKIIFFPIMILWFGVGPGSKIAMGALSAFFPIVISVASGMRQIAPVLIRVGQELSRNAVADDADRSICRRCGRRSSTGSGSGLASRSSARCSPRPSCRTADSAT